MQGILFLRKRFVPEAPQLKSLDDIATNFGQADADEADVKPLMPSSVFNRS